MEQSLSYQAKREVLQQTERVARLMRELELMTMSGHDADSAHLIISPWPFRLVCSLSVAVKECAIFPCA